MGGDDDGIELDGMECDFLSACEVRVKRWDTGMSSFLLCC